MKSKSSVAVPLYVRKEDGSKEAFDQTKLYDSLVKSGAEPHQADKIVRQVIEDMRIENAKRNERTPDQPPHAEILCTAAEIYHEAYRILKHASRVAAARYSLRRSLLQFGPTGFPFEEYVAELFKAKFGYETLTGQIVLGGCVPHEVDVVAWNKHKLVMCEVKYHSDAASKTDTKVALYVKARFEDLSETVFDYGGMQRKLTEGWLITNTRFTDTAITYAKCRGLNMLSWDYPEQGNLQELIESTQLHPITCLTTISESDKRLLMDKNIVLARGVYSKREVLKSIGFTEKKIQDLFSEVDEIMKTVPRG